MRLILVIKCSRRSPSPANPHKTGATYSIVAIVALAQSGMLQIHGKIHSSVKVINSALLDLGAIIYYGWEDQGELHVEVHTEN